MSSDSKTTYEWSCDRCRETYVSDRRFADDGWATLVVNSMYHHDLCNACALDLDRWLKGANTQK